MERELPRYRLRETEFRVDVRNRLLADVERPDNIIRLEDLQFIYGGYIAYLDNEGRNALHSGNSGTEYQLPQMVVLDPEGMAALYGKTVAEISQLTDFDLLIDQEVFRRRIDGELPQVDILGTTFLADSHAGTLTSDTSQILLFELEPYLKDDFYEFPYNTAAKTFTDLDFDAITSIPEDTVWVRMPLDWNLDPVGWARLIGADPKDITINYPPKGKIAAELISWDQTRIYEIMESNQKRLGEKQHEAKAKKKSAGRRKGRGC